MTRETFRKLRILILLLVLFFVGLQTWLTQLRSTDWQQPLWVVVYPINGDGSSVTAQYINNMDEQIFDEIEEFYIREARRYGLTVSDPVTVKLAPQVTSQPPLPPQGGNMFDVVVWSLKMRYWAWSNNNYPGPRPDIQMYVKYYDPTNNKRLGHSLGLKKGMVGVVNAFAATKYAGSNNVIIAHELLHTVGASDKYDLATNQPYFPAGFAEPGRVPLYPQRKAELMAGRIPVAQNKALIPRSLSSVMIGEASATEILWHQDEE
jgi:hypothetical protein